MNKATIVGILIALVLGAGGGYAAAKGSSNGDVDMAKYTNAVSMMNSQAKSAEEMGRMMLMSSSIMQESGAKYKDDSLVQQGKDMQAVAQRHMQESQSQSSGDDMRDMMAQ